MKTNMRLLSLAAAVTVAGCSPKDASKTADTAAVPAAAPVAAAAPAVANVVNIVASDYKYDAPATIPAGLTTFHLTNTGKEPHQASLIRLDSGKTYADMMTGMKNMKPGAPPPGWVVPAGGPNAVLPGASADLTTNLPEGNYAIVCFIPDAKGVPHMMKGMTQGITVTPSTTAAAPEPTADVTVTMSNYKWDFSTPLTSGKHTIKLVTAPGQPHEFTLFQLAPGKTVADVTKFFDGGMKGQPPAMPIGGVAGMSTGLTSYYTVDLKPGDYALVCFLPDGKDGKAHYTKGMTQTIKIT